MNFIRMKRSFILLIVFIVGISFSANAHLFKRKVNRYKNGLREGLWITYVDSANKKIESKGKFKVGREKGKWKYYSEDGVLRRKEVFRKEEIFITYYYDNGKKESCGMALIKLDANLLHFYWTGDWKYYDRIGKLKRIATFKNGEEISERKMDD